MIRSLRLFLAFTGLSFAAQLLSQPGSQNNTLRGRILYQSSGNKPAIGVRIAEPDATAVFSLNNGDYELRFQNKRNGEALALEIGRDNAQGQKIELVNEKEVKAAKLPAAADNMLEIIVCPAGQRDIAAQKYYRILRTTADRELERKKKEVEGLLAQKEKDYQKISDLFAQLDKIQVALDSAKIREQAFNIASINLDRASQLVKDAVKKIDEENDVEGALKILSAEALDTAYEHASALKKQAEAAIRQVIEGYEFKISLLEPQFKYGEVAECYEKIAGIYEKEEYDKEGLAANLTGAAANWGLNGDYQKQLEFNLKVLTIYEKNLPANHPHLATSYSNLAVTYFNLGEYQKALEFYLKGLSIREKAVPSNHFDLAWSYDELSIIYNLIGNYQKALEFNLKGLAIREEILTSDHLYLAKSYLNLADIYSKLGDYQKGLEFNLKALAIREKSLAPEHPILAASYINLAWTYGRLGDYQKQLEFNLKALVINEKVLPVSHPQMAASYNNLASTYRNHGEYQKALEFNLKALDIRKKSLPADHPSMSESYESLAVTFGCLGDYQKQLEFDLKTLGIREKILPVEHPNLALSYNNLANTYVNLGDYQKALEFHLKALAIWEKKLPANHPNLAISYTNIGRTYRDVGEYKKGIEYGQKAVSIGESLNPKHHFLNRFYYNLGITYIKARQYPEAKTALEKSETLKAEAGLYKGWAMYYALQKKKKQSIESLQKAVELGFKDLKWIETEPDLNNIRKEKGYKDLVEQLKKQ